MPNFETFFRSTISSWWHCSIPIPPQPNYINDGNTHYQHHYQCNTTTTSNDDNILHAPFEQFLEPWEKERQVPNSQTAAAAAAAAAASSASLRL
jgi:hypothetical protein